MRASETARCVQFLNYNDEKHISCIPETTIALFSDNKIMIMQQYMVEALRLCAI